MPLDRCKPIMRVEMDPHHLRIHGDEPETLYRMFRKLGYSWDIAMGYLTHWGFRFCLLAITLWQEFKQLGYVGL